MDYEDDAESEMLTSSGGRRRQPSNKNDQQQQQRRGLLGRGGQRGGRRGNNEEERRRIRKWGPRGVMRRIRGKGIPGQEGEKPEDESLLTDGDGGFYDNDPYGDMDYDEEDSRPINVMSDDDEEDDFLDPDGYIDYSQNDQEEGDEEVCADDDDGDYESGSEEEEDDDDGDEGEYEQPGDGQDGEWGRYDDEYGDKPGGDSSNHDGGGSYHDNGGYNNGGGSYRDGDGKNDRGGYYDGENRREYGSYNGGRRNRNGPRNVVLRQLSKIGRGRRGRGRGRNSSSNLDHTNLRGSGSINPYQDSGTNVRGRIEGFGSKPEVEQHRNLRKMLKNFRDRRIAARNGEAGMKRMSIDGAQRKRNWIERIDNALDNLADAALQHPGFDGYMTSSARKVTVQKKGGTESTGNSSKDSYLRTQFGDDNAYIIYLEGEQVATQLEVLSYKNRIKELEAEIRKLKGIEDGDDSDSSHDSSAASYDSSNTGEMDEKESEIEWQTGVPEEGDLLGIEGTTEAPSNKEESTEAAPTADLLQTSPEGQPGETEEGDLIGIETASNEQGTTEAPTADLLEIPPEGQIPETPTATASSPNLPAEQIQEKTPETNTEAATEQTDGALAVDFNVRNEAKDIVDSILADLLTEKKVTSLITDDEADINDSLRSMKMEPPAAEAKNSAPTDLLPEPPADAPPLPPTDDPPELPSADPPMPPTEVPPEPPMDESPTPPTDVPPEPPTDDPQKEAVSEKAPTAEGSDDTDVTQNQASTEASESTPDTEPTTTTEVKSED